MNGAWEEMFLGGSFFGQTGSFEKRVLLKPGIPVSQGPRRDARSVNNCELHARDRLWNQPFNELLQFVRLGGNILVHCEHGYHRSPIVAGLVWMALHNSKDVGCMSKRKLQWFLDTLSSIREISPVRPADNLGAGVWQETRKNMGLQRCQRWADEVADAVASQDAADDAAVSQDAADAAASQQGGRQKKMHCSRSNKIHRESAPLQPVPEVEATCACSRTHIFRERLSARLCR